MFWEATTFESALQLGVAAHAGPVEHACAQSSSGLGVIVLALLAFYALASVLPGRWASAAR